MERWQITERVQTDAGNWQDLAEYTEGDIVEALRDAKEEEAYRLKALKKCGPSYAGPDPCFMTQAVLALEQELDRRHKANPGHPVRAPEDI